MNKRETETETERDIEAETDRQKQRETKTETDKCINNSIQYITLQYMNNTCMYPNYYATVYELYMHVKT